MHLSIIKQLSEGQEKGLFAVGDDDQSIYSWRGGPPDYILSFEKDFKGANIDELPECHRCGESILKSALCIVEENKPYRKDKRIKSITEHKGELFIYNVPSEIKEAEIIVKKLKKAINAKNDIIILVPRHSFADMLKKELKNNRITYTCRMDVEKKGLAVLDTVISWLNEVDNNLLLRFCIEKIVIKQFKSKNILVLSKISKLWKLAFGEKKSLFKIIQESTDSDIKKLYSFLNEIIRSYERKPSEFIGTVTDILVLWKNQDELQKEVSYWVEEGRGQSAASSSVVRILAMQGAKGLQADAVFIIGITEGIIPKDKLTEEEKREVRRLLYVSMTRAKRQLHLFHARKRSPKVSYQSNFEKGLRLSPFASAIPKEYCNQIYIKQ